MSKFKINKKRSSIVTEYILQSIKDGVYKVGDQIPSERELCEILDVGRSSVREATKSLVNMNVLETKVGVGIFVKRTEFNALVDTYVVSSLISSKVSLDLLEFRLMLEVQIVKKAAQVATKEDFKRMEIALEMQRDAIANLKPSLDSDLLFHRAIVISANNYVLLKVYDSISDLLVTVREQLLINDPKEESLNYHTEIFKAIKNHDEQGAEYWMKQHLNDVISSYKKLIEKKEN